MWPFSSIRRRALLARGADASRLTQPMRVCELCGDIVVIASYPDHYSTHVRRVLDESHPPTNGGEAYREGQAVRPNIDIYVIESPSHGDSGDGWKRYSAFYAKAVAKLHAAYPPTAEFQCLPQRYWFAKSLGALLVIIRY